MDNQFLLALIPRNFMETSPAWLTTLFVTVIPYTPMDIIAFAMVFVLIYMINPLGLANRKIHYCRFNKPEERDETNIWTAIRSSYLIYFALMFMVNFNTISNYRAHSMLPSIGTV